MFARNMMMRQTGAHEKTREHADDGFAVGEAFVVSLFFKQRPGGFAAEDRKTPTRRWTTPRRRTGTEPARSTFPASTTPCRARGSARFLSARSRKTRPRDAPNARRRRRTLNDFYVTSKSRVAARAVSTARPPSKWRRHASAFATGNARQVRWCFSGNAVTTRKTVRNPGKACHAARTSPASASRAVKRPRRDRSRRRRLRSVPARGPWGPDRIRATTRMTPIAKMHRSGADAPAVRTRARRCVSRFLRASRANARRLAAVSKKFHREKKKKAFLRLFFTFSNGVCSLRFDRRGAEKQMSVENVLELSNGAPLSRQLRARSPSPPQHERARLASHASPASRVRRLPGTMSDPVPVSSKPAGDADEGEEIRQVARGHQRFSIKMAGAILALTRRRPRW